MSEDLLGANSDSAEGNTNSAEPPKKKVKRVTQSQYWMFTWNNPPVDALEQLKEGLRGREYIFEYEKGDKYLEEGWRRWVPINYKEVVATEHIQGFVWDRESKFRWSELEMCSEIHWESASPRIKKDNKKKIWLAVMYCSKDDRYYRTIEGKEERREWCKLTYTDKLKPEAWKYMCPRDLLIEDLPEPWPHQRALIDQFGEDCPPFHNKIYWYYDREGEIGKTMMLRWLALKHHFVLLGGATKNVRSYMAKHPACGYMMNITRDEQDYINYRVLEQASDQFFCDTFGAEYTGMVCRQSAWIVCCANFPPMWGKMSEGRWMCYEHVEGSWVQKTRPGLTGP